MSIDLQMSPIQWTSVASRLIGEYFDFSQPYIDKDYKGLDPQVRFVSTQLFIDCQLTSESVLLLVRAGKEWDADLVMRSVVEGTLKYIYMMASTPDESMLRTTEFWKTLPSYAAIKRSERAKNVLQSVENPDDTRWRPFLDLILTDAEVIAARNGTNRQERKELEERWSFSGIVKHFSTSDLPELNRFAMLAHGYGNSSHLIHKDGDGVAMVWERLRRNPERQAAITLAHAARLISDVCSFSRLRLWFLLKACNCDTTRIDEIANNHSPLFKALQEAYEVFSSAEYGEPIGQTSEITST